MPRPALPKQLKRSVVVYVLLRDGEAELLDVRRRPRRSSRGGYLRDVFLASLKRKRL